MKIINDKYLALNNLREEFLKGRPFPHIVLDDFLDEELFQKLHTDFNNEVTSNGKSFNSTVEEKKWISLNSSLPQKISNIVNFFNSEEWVENLKGLCDVDSLVATPHGNTLLANYHIMGPGGVLGPHVDHSSEPKKGIPHVLNLLIYLNDNWEEKDGGSTQLFNRTGKKVIKNVTFKPNRAVIFLHTPYSFHGVERINNECKNKRRTIYVDYYSESKTPYLNHNLDFSNKWFTHNTTFKLPHWSQYFQKKNKAYLKTLVKYHIRRIQSIM